MGKDKMKEKERHRTIRRNKKERLTKLEMLETYLEKYHSNILEEFEEFYENSKIVTSTTPAEKPPLQDSVKFKDGSTIESLPEQDANLKLHARTRRLVARSGVKRCTMERLAVGVN